LSGENKINIMFIRIPYYDAKKINIVASKSCKNKYSDPNKIGNNLIEKICQFVFILTHLANGQCELLPSLDVCRQSVCYLFILQASS
jgi:hypothetical protein